VAGKSKNAGRRLLVLKHNRWWFRRAIPEVCQRALGRGKFYMVNLDTSDLKAAQRLRDALEVETSDVFAAVRSGKTVAKETLTAREQGLLYREALADAAERDTGEEHDDAYEIAVLAAEATAESLRNEIDRRAFLDALHAKEDVAAHVEAHLVTLNVIPKSKGERRGQIGRFAEWAREQRPALTIDRVDRRQAGKYVSEVIDQMDAKTQSKHLMALRGYWSYLGARGIVELPESAPRGSGWPWNNQQIRSKTTRVERGSREEREREFTSEEVQRLLYAPYPGGMMKEHERQLRDATKIALLSGLRMDEVLTLWVQDVKEGEDGAGLVFDIQAGKTEAAARPVPIHPELAEIVQRRLRDERGVDKPSNALLFDELATERNAKDVFSKRFSRFRRALGVHEKRDGKRRSLVNFHSARRWFATSADWMGQQEAVIKDVIGHLPDKKNTTRASYIARSSGAQMRACVEAVKLPAGS
jgi:integrase